MTQGSDNQRREQSAGLLGYYLGLTEASERKNLEAEFVDQPQRLQAALKKIETRLAPLGADAVPPIPQNLTANVLQRVAQVGQSIPFPQTQPTLVTGEMATGSRGRPFLALREIVGLAAAILIFVGIFVPGYQDARFVAYRNNCADNLRSIGTGYASYAEMNHGFWPYTRTVAPGASWGRVPGGGQYQGNSRDVYQFVARQLVSPKAYVCPSRPGDMPLNATAVNQVDDFPSPRNNSYSFFFVIRPTRGAEIESATPLVADMTPLLDEERQIIPAERIMPNSNNHGCSAGQNVLRANLSAQYHRTPAVGLNNDDIYRLIGVNRYTGQERPKVKNDAFLVP